MEQHITVRINYLLKHLVPKVAYPLLLKYKYYIKMGKICNLTNPITFSEKVQWGKLHRDNKKLSDYADKIRVRDYAREVIGEEYLIPLVGSVYSSVDHIDFGSLPDQFVIKTNHGCGFNYIVKDKSLVDLDELKKTVSQWMKIDYSYYGLELQYRYIKPKIFVEKYLVQEGMTDLPDYKFFCFNGKVFCSYTMVNYAFDHSKGKLGFFDRDYKLMHCYRKDFEHLEDQLAKPKNYEIMVDLAEKLATGFSHVRVDFYNIEGEIFFGEMTFSNAGGFCRFEPEDFDRVLGEQWNLNSGI